MSEPNQWTKEDYLALYELCCIQARIALAMETIDAYEHPVLSYSLVPEHQYHGAQARKRWQDKQLEGKLATAPEHVVKAFEICRSEIPPHQTE